jgi:hypothetical protein
MCWGSLAVGGLVKSRLEAYGQLMGNGLLLKNQHHDVPMTRSIPFRFKNEVCTVGNYTLLIEANPRRVAI